MRVKVCGIGSLKDALACADAGADALGFVLWASSPRGVTIRAAARICERLPPFVTRVGVFVDEDPETIATAVEACGLDWVQLAGTEDRHQCRRIAARVDRARIMKTFRVGPGFSAARAFRGFDVQAFHLDAAVPGRYGGTGREVPWRAAARARELAPSLVLAGGLTPENVARAIARVRPAAVDVASGVERTPGIKDHARVRAFVDAARRA